MSQVTQVAQSMQQLLTTTADRLAKTTGAIRRVRLFTGSTLAQTFIAGWMENPQATLCELAHAASLVGVKASKQALDKKLNNDKVGDFFQELLSQAIDQVITAEEPMTTPLLQRFNEIHLDDSTTISLPAEWANKFPGTGCRNGQTAAMKLQCRLSLRSGRLRCLRVTAGKASDRNSTLQDEPVEKGALRLADLGYFRLKTLRQIDEKGGYWLTRVQAGTNIYSQDGERIDWEKLSRAKCPVTGRRVRMIDRRVDLGQEKVGCRLLCLRCPVEVAKARRKKLLQDCRNRRRKPGRMQKLFCEWTVLATNVPEAFLSVLEALILQRMRWQIELLFLLFKEYGCVDKSRSDQPTRRCVEVMAKLVAVVIHHWQLLVTVWPEPGRSLVKASRILRKFVYMWLNAIRCVGELEKVLRTVQRTLQDPPKVDKRKEAPSAFQLWQTPELAHYEGLS